MGAQPQPTPDVFDQIHAQSGGDVFDQIHQSAKPKPPQGLWDKFMDVSEGAKSAAENLSLGTYEMFRKAVGALGFDGLPPVSDELKKGAEVPPNASDAFRFGRGLANTGPFFAAGANPLAAAGVAGAETGGDPTAMVGAGLTAGALNVAGKAIPAAGRFLKNAPAIPSSVTDTVGVVSPRAAHVLKTLDRIRRAVGSAPEEAAAAPIASKSVITPGEATPPARPDWRNDLVQQLNQGPAEVPEAVPEPTTVPPESYVPQNLQSNPRAMEAAKKLQQQMGAAMPKEPVNPLKRAAAEEPGSAAEAVNRDKRAVAIANFLHQGGNGISLEDAGNMAAEQWRMADQGAAQQFGMATRGVIPSPATRKAALVELGRLERSKQLSQQLADEMAKNPAPVLNIGDKALLKNGKRVKVTKVNPDSTYEGDEVPPQ